MAKPTTDASPAVDSTTVDHRFHLEVRALRTGEWLRIESSPCGQTREGFEAEMRRMRPILATREWRIVGQSLSPEVLPGWYRNARTHCRVLRIDDRYLPVDPRGDAMESCTMTASQMRDWLNHRHLARL